MNHRANGAEGLADDEGCDSCVVHMVSNGMDACARRNIYLLSRMQVVYTVFR